MNKAWNNIAAVSKNGTNKERSTLVRTSVGELKTSKCWLKSNYLICKHRKKDETITYIPAWSTDSVWRENWLYIIKNTLILQRAIIKEISHNGGWSLIRVTTGDCSDENFNSEGLIWWELQWLTPMTMFEIP